MLRLLELLRTAVVDTRTQTIEWPGASGVEYTYWIYPIGQAFKAEPGNYVFTRETSAGEHLPLYCGETKDLSERFDSHHKWQCVVDNGVTHIHAHTNAGSEQARRDEESDLIAKWSPICND